MTIQIPFPRPTPPTTDPDKAITKSGGDGIYVHGETTDHSIVGVPITLVGTGRAGIIYDVDTLHLRDVIEDCSVTIRDAVDSAYQMWGIRRYGLSSGHMARVAVDGVVKEHGCYDAVWGNYTYEDCLFTNCGAQGLQIRLTNNAADVHWADPKKVLINRVSIIECGLKRGVGRAGFGLSVKTLGPNASVEIKDVMIQTVQQTAVKVYNGQVYDSFGAMIVEFCESAYIHDCLIAMRAPDRDTMQLFDYGMKGPTGSGPKHIVVDNVCFRRGNGLAVREGDGDSIEIKNCEGAGFIKIFTYQSGVWRLARQVPLEQGFSWQR